MKLQKRYLKSIAFFYIGLLSSCSNNPSSASTSKVLQEISINIAKDPCTLDSRKARLLNDFNMIRTFNEGLYRLDINGNLIEGVAQKCTLSEDKKTYKIELKETLWSNGDALTAHDFIYSWKSSLDRNFPSPFASLLFCIRNGKAIKDGTLPASLLGVHAEGDYTLIIELEEQTPFFKELLTLPIFFAVNESIVRENEDWHTNVDHYVCNGPFKLSDWQHKNELIAEKNNRYYDAKSVKLQKITMVMVDAITGLHMYQNNELAWVGSPFSKVANEIVEHSENFKDLFITPILFTYFLRANVTSHPLQDLNLRKSIAVAINRKEIVEYVLNKAGVVATGLVPTSMGLQETPYFNDGDTELALDFLSKSCKALNITKEKLPTLTLIYSGSPDDEVPAVIQDQLRKYLGLKIKLEALEAKVYLDRMSKGDYDLSFGSWVADFDDPINFLEVFKTKHVGTNTTNWESLDYIKAIDSSYHCDNTEDRLFALKKSEQILMDQMPIIPLYNKSLVHMQRENLKDVLLTKTGTLDFKWAYISN